MVSVTQPSGPTDTLPGPPNGRDRDIWGGLEPRLRPLWVTLVVALVLHIPMFPTALGYWVRVWFQEPEELADAPEQPLQIPISIDLLSDKPPSEDGLAPDEASVPPDLDDFDDEPDAPGQDTDDEDDIMDAFEDDDEPEPKPEPKEEPKAPEPADAGVPDAAPEPDAGVPEPKTPEPVAKKPAPLPRGKLKDAYEVAGDRASVRAQHPNVNVLLAADVLRKRALADELTVLLAAVPQWDELIGGTGLDPMKDFDRILISGPEFKKAQNIVVAIRYRKSMSAYDMKAAIDKVVKRAGDQGKWLDNAELPTAVIGDKGQRFAVIVPNKRLLWILPKAQESDLALLKEADPFERTPSAGIVLDLKSPYRPLRERGFPLPKTISHLRVHFNVKGDGYELLAEAWDKSPGDAKLHKAALEAAIDALPKLDIDVLGFKKEIRAIGEPTFEVAGNRIYATAPVSEAQLARILKFIKLDVDDKNEQKKQRAKKRKEAREKLDKAKSLIDDAEQGADDEPEPNAPDRRVDPDAPSAPPAPAPSATPPAAPPPAPAPAP